MKEFDPIQDRLGWSPEPGAPTQLLGSFAVKGFSEAWRLVGTGGRVPSGMDCPHRVGERHPLEPLKGPTGGSRLVVRTGFKVPAPAFQPTSLGKHGSMSGRVVDLGSRTLKESL